MCACGPACMRMRAYVCVCLCTLSSPLYVSMRWPSSQLAYSNADWFREKLSALGAALHFLLILMASLHYHGVVYTPGLVAWMDNSCFGSAPPDIIGYAALMVSRWWRTFMLRAAWSGPCDTRPASFLPDSGLPVHHLIQVTLGSTYLPPLSVKTNFLVVG